MKYSLKTYRILVPRRGFRWEALMDLPAQQTDEEFESFMRDKGFTKEE